MAERFIFRVTSATARLRFGFVPGTPDRPPRFYLELVVNARGETRTSGWSNAHLARANNDRNIVFKFLADSPDTPVPQVITPISARWVERYTGVTETVTIVADTNRLTVPVTGPLAIAVQKAVANHKAAAKAKAPVKKKPAPKKAAKPAPKKKPATKKAKKK